MNSEEADRLVVQFRRDGTEGHMLSRCLVAHDLNATELTAVRKELRDILNTSLLLSPAVEKRLTDVYDKLNHCIVVSRKLIRGEAPW